jgi:hypothetical protein
MSMMSLLVPRLHDLKQRIHAAAPYGVVPVFFNFFQGRATTFAILFTIVGIVGWLKGRDLTSYALFVTAIQGLIFCHSVKEDWFSSKNQQAQSTQIVNNVTVDPNAIPAATNAPQPPSA